MNDVTGFGGGGRDPFRFEIGNIDLDRLRRMMRWGLWFLVVILGWSALNWAQTFYTDLLWFGGLGHEEVLVKIVTTRALLFVLAVVLFLALGVPALYLAFRSSDRPPRAEGPLAPLDYHFIRQFLVRAALGIALVLGLFLAFYPAAEWETALLFLNAVPFGEADPVFGHDFSFFVFTLPAVRVVHVWLVMAVGSIGLILAAFHYVTDRLRGEPELFTGVARKQLAVVGALLFLLIAAGHWLGRYELMYSSTGTVFGVGYTDDHVNLPGRALLTAVAVITAACVFWGGVFSAGYRWIVWPAAAWLGLTIIVGTLAPVAVQRLRVEPSELALEREYLANNIEFTRRGFGLDRVQSRDHPALGIIEPRVVADNEGTLRNVRLWDESPLLESYNQIQFFRLYYDFLAVHTDRYVVDDQLRQVMLATRELSAEKLPGEAQRWVNRRLQFTHGYGVAMSPVTEVEADGRPTFFIRDLPPVGVIPLERPEVYYGLKSLDYVIAQTRMQEFNYPGAEGPEYTRYEGSGGVLVGSFLRRLFYAWQFRDLNILISGEIEEDSRIQYRRTITQRVATISPFLMRDREPYAVVADGRLLWIQDLYTATNRYPYSTRWGDRFNYIRNSAKAVVDAYDGSVDYYIFEPDDPLIQAYQSIFPDLFRSRDELPESLRAHVRFPLDLFTVQTQMLLQYHMQDPTVFYNKEDQWSVPVQTSFGRSAPLRPYYIVARLPGEPREEFLLIQPFTPDNRHNLVGWMAARSDGANYGELMLFDFPTGRHVDGPNQIEARIDNDAVISEQFTLWGQVGSEVSRGILLVIPLGEAILYAEPIFLTPETLDFPELRRIILADSRQVVMHRTLEQSVGALVGELPPVAPVAEAAVPEADAEADGGPVDPAVVDALRDGLEETIERLREMLEELDRLSR